LFWNRKSSGAAAQVQNMTPSQVYQGLEQDTIVLVDVREPQEHASERIEGSLLNPLSRFDPAALPSGTKQVVLYCAVGRRSATAVERCRAAGVAVTSHLAGGLQAWKSARLPTVSG
jgi:rhodanese-related sulfurtransferase